MSGNKFTSVDVRVVVRELEQEAVGRRVVNIYDLSEKTYVFKLSGLTTAQDGARNLLLIESGVRFHMTKYARQLPELPSPFTMKLRKFIRTKRLEAVTQIGVDRVVDLRFGAGDAVIHVILEFYAGGNVVMTDGNYEVLALLRSHQFAEDISLKVGEIYPVAYSTNISTVPGDQLTLSCADFKRWITSRAHSKDASAAIATAAAVERGKAGKGKTKSLTLRQLLLQKDSGVAHFGPEILDHAILGASLKPSLKVEQLVQLDDATLEVLVSELEEAASLLRLLDTDCEGFIICAGEDHFLEYTPLLLRQHAGVAHKRYDNFTAAVDEFFFRIEDQKMKREEEQRELALQRKVNKVKEDHDRQLDALAKQQEYFQNCALLLELHSEEVDKAMLVINSALQVEMPWEDIEKMVAMETARGNPIAAMIRRLKLDVGKVVLGFPRSELTRILGAEEDDGDPGEEEVEIEVDLALTARANASQIYTSKKAASVKEAKTTAAAEKALKAVQEQVQKTLQQQRVKQNIKAQRKVHWFEKFYWFITTEGFLVACGRDAQQNELLVKRYLGAKDIFVHADIHGASACVVFAQRSGETVISASPLALQEAGIFAVCRSNAWSAKLVVSAYWVHAHQVSKAAPAGEYLRTGGFMIYGKKNYLPPMPLEMGFGVLFCVNPDSASRHAKDRRLKTVEQDAEETEELLARMQKYSLQPQETAIDGDVDMDEGETGDGDGEEEEKVLDEPALQLMEDEGVAADSTVTIDVTNIDAPSALSPTSPNEMIQSWDQEELGLAEEAAAETRNTDLSDGDDAAAAPPSSESERDQSEPRGRQTRPSASIPAAAAGKKRKLNRKKARRYAEQDEEDRDLAMRVLGHSSRAAERDQERVKSTQKGKLQQRQEKAGLQLLKQQWHELVGLLPAAVQKAMEELMAAGLVDADDIEAHEMKELALFPADQGVRILSLFRDGKNLAKVTNKSGYLAGIMRKVHKDQAQPRKGPAAGPGAVVLEETVQPETAEEAIELGVDISELCLLVDCPLPDDSLLYALPVCAPYFSMQRCKYKVKLTPGQTKKGKAAKLAIDLFFKQKECSNAERLLLRNIGDNELHLNMLNEVKLSMPGLHQQQKNRKQRGQAKNSKS